MVHHPELSANLIEFCRVLRNEGLPIGLTEETDAMRALDSIKIADPEEFRLTLRIILARKRREQESFDRLFNSYWHGKIQSDSSDLGLRKKHSYQVPKMTLLNPVLGNWSDSFEKQEQSTYSPLE